MFKNYCEVAIYGLDPKGILHLLRLSQKAIIFLLHKWFSRHLS